MTEAVDIGCAPYEEPCAQLGEDGYERRAQRECRALIRQLRRMHGNEPQGAELRVTRNPHDWGVYLSVACVFDPGAEAAVQYAQQVVDGLPSRWDAEARRELSASDQPRFPPGQLVATPNALNTLNQAEIHDALARHLHGDWGALDSVDAQANERALHDGTRLLSAYHATDGTRFWIITEADRSVTTVLLPEDY